MYVNIRTMEPGLIMPDEKKWPVAPSRKGRGSLTVWLERDLLRRLRILSAERERTIQALIEEAVLLILERHEANKA